MDVGADPMDTKYEDGTEWELTPESHPPCEQDSPCEEMSSHVSLVPANMARPPVQWSVREVKVWLEFCVTEFSLPTICVNKFDMNGKALTLLTRTDFIERAPHAGDILYNVFQRCLQQERPGYMRPPAFMPTHATLPAPEILPRQPQILSARFSYIPIRPQPSSGINGSKPIYPTSGSLTLAASDDSVPVGLSVPASMLSPSPSERYPLDSDSSPNENDLSPPHSSDHEMEHEEEVNFDPGSDVRCDISEQNCDGVCRLLWEFIYQLLQDTKWSELVSWESEGDLTFRILNPTNLADAWGKQKNRSNMTYEKLSRALRYYYKMNIIKKVPGKRLTYKFLQHPAAIRKGQRGARPHSSRQARARSADTDHETATPDSSTFIPPQALSISPTPSSTATLTSLDSIVGTHSPRHHVNPDELSGSIMTPAFRRDTEDQHFQFSSQRIRASQDRGSFLYREAADCSTSDAAINARALRNVSPGTHLEAKQNQRSNVYNGQQQGAPEDNDFLRRSQMSAFNTSPETISNGKSLVVMDKAVEPVPNLQINRGHAYEDKGHLSLRIPEQDSHSFTYYDGAKYTSTQGLNQEKNVFSRSSSPSSSSTPLSFRSRPLLRFNKGNCSGDSGYPTLYASALRGHHQHPQLVSLSCTPPPLPSYTYSQQHLNHISTEPYQNYTKSHFKSQTLSFTPESGRISSNTPYPYRSRHSLKREACDQEQDEPQDLSLKAGLKKPDSSKDNSQSDLPRESGMEDTHRDSPRSNSSDSAYSSDRADFVKEETPGSVE